MQVFSVSCWGLVFLPPQGRYFHDRNQALEFDIAFYLTDVAHHIWKSKDNLTLMSRSYRILSYTIPCTSTDYTHKHVSTWNADCSWKQLLLKWLTLNIIVVECHMFNKRLIRDRWSNDICNVLVDHTACITPFIAKIFLIYQKIKQCTVCSTFIYACDDIWNNVHSHIWFKHSLNTKSALFFNIS